MTPRLQAVPPALIGAGFAGLVAAVAGHWRADASAVDRYLILAGAVWAVANRWKEATSDPHPRPWFGLPVLALGAVLYPLGWAGHFVLANARSLPFWCLWLGLALTAGGWVLARFGWRPLFKLSFPIAFVALALPPPESLLHQFQQQLQTWTTDLSEWVLRLVGYSVQRPPGGFLLVLQGGELGIEETCSGVKALTALTAMAAFVAFVRRFGLVRGGLLVLAAVPVVVAVNVLRVTLSGVIQEAAGAEYIRGGWHDALGFGTVLVGLGVIFLLARLVSRRATTATATATPTPVPISNPWPATALLTASLVVTLAVIWHGRTLVPPPVPLPPFEELPTRLGDWTEHRRPPVPPHVADLLQPDAILHREYRNPLGRWATVWVIYWTSAHAVRGYHHPDVCLPNVGYTATARGVVNVTPTGGGELPLTARTLSGQGGELYVLYWTQTGQRVWGPADELEAQDNLRYDRLLNRAAEQWTDPSPPQPAGRLVVLVGSPQPTAFGRAEVEAFAKLVADEVYRFCPSAAPPVPADR
jgi:EpsI family protein